MSVPFSVLLFPFNLVLKMLSLTTCSYEKCFEKPSITMINYMHFAENELEVCEYVQDYGALSAALFPFFNCTVHWRKVSFTFSVSVLVR